LDQLLGNLGLRQRSSDPVRTLSRGMRQRLSLARALLHQPRLVLLDEPYTGLDMQATELLDGVLLEMAARGRTVLLTTHDLPTALRSGSKLAVLVEGRIAYETPQGPLSESELKDIYRDLIGASK
ncbi:MAG: ATP-binding cassette domain-containing protein, partial [Anaerolineae bacterium]|nr:ATP-binding cassette domain-containing protein [Anaerolineae bacterium]